MRKTTSSDRVTWSWKQRIAVGLLITGSTLLAGAFLLWTLHSVEPIHHLTASWYDVRVFDGLTLQGEEQFRLQGDRYVGGAAMAGVMMIVSAAGIMGLN